MDDSSQDKHLPASQRKIDKSRREGQVARSRDLGHLGALGGGVALLAAFATPFADRTRELLSQGLRFDANSLSDPAQMTLRLSELGVQMLTLLAPLFAVVVLVAVATSVLAGGWNFTLKPLEPKFSKLNPLTGLGRVFSGQQLTDALKASFLAIVLGSVGALYMGQRWLKHAELLSMPLPAALASGAQLVFEGLVLVAGVLALFALVDVPLQRQLHLRRMRMSVQEMKKEFKEVEGNVEVKAQLKARMRESANRRSLAAVPLADLVVMNPRTMPWRSSTTSRAWPRRAWSPRAPI